MSILIEERNGAYYLCREEGLALTPAGNAYVFPCYALAEAVSQELEAYEKKRDEDKRVKHAFPPLLQLASTLFDLMRKNREQVVEGLVSRVVTELLCHRATKPETLTLKQQEIWQPVLEWCAMRFGALLCPHTGIFPQEPPADCIRALYQAVSSYDDYRLMGLSNAVEVSGSLVLGLALAEGHLTAADVFHAAELETEFQMTTWGVDPLAAARLDSIRTDIDLSERWFSLLKTN